MLNEEFFIESNGVKLNTIIKGRNSDSDIIIALHGGPGTGAKSLMNRKGIKLLENDFLVVYFDQRGCDESKYDIKQGIQLDDLLNDIDNVVDYFKAKYTDKKIYLLGCSFGGFLGFLYMDKYPNKCEKFVATSPALSFEALLTKEYIFKQAKKYENKIPKPLLATLKVLPINKKSILKLINSEKVESLVWSRNNNPRNFMHLYSMRNWIFDKDLRESFKDYKQPILILQGTEDDECKFDIVQTAVEKAENKNIIIEAYNNCGHRLFDDAPEKFYDDIVSFYESE